MLRKQTYILILIAFLSSCSAVRYVQDGEYRLVKNSMTVSSDSPRERRNVLKLYPEDYIQQRPNNRFLGMGLNTAFYNATDSSKHTGWHKFWGQKVGEKPVILDSSLVEESKEEIGMYLASNGYFNSDIEDTIITYGNRKAKVKYSVDVSTPYRLRNVRYRIDDKFIEPLVMADTASTILKAGKVFTTNDFELERSRISNNLKNHGFWGFGVNYISYFIDSTIGNNQFDVSVRIRRHMEKIDSLGREVYENHPVYKVSSITIDTEYDGTRSTDVKYDSVELNGINVKYIDKLDIRAKILCKAIQFSAGELYNQKMVEKTYDNLQSLGFNTTILFSQDEDSSDNDPIVRESDEGKKVSTNKHNISCLIQCSPNTRQGISTDFEASTTSQYFSLALLLGYNNNNIFGGAERFNLNLRGAYEFMWQKGKNNSYEVGVSTSITAPRFWASISDEKAKKFTDAQTKVSLSYTAQRRPDYSRMVLGGTFGYSWKIGGKSYITINPLDVYMVSVPRVDSAFLESIQNPYLRNSYTSQLLPGGSVSYTYNYNSNYSQDNFAVKISADYSGNLLRLASKLGLLSEYNEYLSDYSIDSYYRLLGIRFAQYARLHLEMLGRKNVGEDSQIAWRFLAAGGYAYGNSKSLPFERLYFAGGSNSMRGWQQRTLGPGGVQIDSLGIYPNQLGDFKLEANFEYRKHLFLGFNAAIFFDVGNVWMNSKGEDRPEARFNFLNFYKQLGFNTGFGLRYNIADMMILRLDWGWKLHNPNMPENQRWFHNLGISDTAIHFAIGLPF